MVVHKEGFSHEWDELLYKNSSRVAVKGAYTNRKDIPRFEFQDEELVDDPDPESTDQGEESSEKQKAKIVNHIEYAKTQAVQSPAEKGEENEAMATI